MNLNNRLIIGACTKRVYDSITKTETKVKLPAIIVIVTTDQYSPENDTDSTINCSRSELERIAQCLADGRNFIVS